MIVRGLAEANGGRASRQPDVDRNEFRAHLDERRMDATIKPPPLRAPVPDGFTLDDIDIDIDTEAGTVSCPAGVSVPLTPARRASFGPRSF